MRRIKNSDKLKKEGFITSLLKLESSNAERNYMEHFNNTNDDNNNTKNDTYDGKIRDKISDIRMILSRLGNTITSNDRKSFLIKKEQIKKELSEIENKKNLSDEEK